MSQLYFWAISAGIILAFTTKNQGLRRLGRISWGQNLGICFETAGRQQIERIVLPSTTASILRQYSILVILSEVILKYCPRARAADPDPHPSVGTWEQLEPRGGSENFYQMSY